MNEIINGLLLGSIYDCNSFNLNENNIKTIINCTKDLPFPDHIDRSICHIRIPIDDNINETLDIIGVVNFIKKQLQSNRRIFIHCQMGKSRSASFVIAYIMASRHLNYNQAYKYVKIRRPCIKPNIGFERQLISFENYLYRS